jgi:hypothetical protein
MVIHIPTPAKLSKRLLAQSQPLNRQYHAKRSIRGLHKLPQSGMQHRGATHSRTHETQEADRKKVPVLHSSAYQLHILWHRDAGTSCHEDTKAVGSVSISRFSSILAPLLAIITVDILCWIPSLRTSFLLPLFYKSID